MWSTCLGYAVSSAPSWSQRRNGRSHTNLSFDHRQIVQDCGRYFIPVFHKSKPLVKAACEKISKLHARELEPSICHSPLPHLILPGNGCASGFRIQFLTWSDSVHMIVAQSPVSRAVFSSWSRCRVSNVGVWLWDSSSLGDGEVYCRRP